MAALTPGDKRVGLVSLGILVLAVAAVIAAHVAADSSPSNNPTHLTQPTTTELGTAGTNLVDWQYNNSSNPLGVVVENVAGQTSWVGSDQYPGTWTFHSAAHGATTVTWTLKALPGNQGGFRNGSTQVFKFQISQNGEELTPLNADGQFVMGLEDPSYGS